MNDGDVRLPIHCDSDGKIRSAVLCLSIMIRLTQGLIFVIHLDESWDAGLNEDNRTENEHEGLKTTNE